MNRTTFIAGLSHSHGFSDTGVPARPRSAGHSGADPPDSARAEARRRVPVAHVRAAHSVSVGEAPPDPALGAAAAAYGGDHVDCPRIRQAVPAERWRRD